MVSSPNFSTIPLKIAPLFGGEAALKDARCGKSRDFRETFQWGQEAISLPWTIVKRLLYFFQEGKRVNISIKFVNPKYITKESGNPQSQKTFRKFFTFHRIRDDNAYIGKKFLADSAAANPQKRHSTRYACTGGHDLGPNGQNACRQYTKHLL